MIRCRVSRQGMPDLPAAVLSRLATDLRNGRMTTRLNGEIVTEERPTISSRRPVLLWLPNGDGNKVVMIFCDRHATSLIILAAPA